MIRIVNDPITDLIAVINMLYPNKNIDIYYDPRMDENNNELVSILEDIIYINPNVSILEIFDLILYNISYVIIETDDPEDPKIDEEAEKIRTIYRDMTHHPSNNLLH